MTFGWRDFCSSLCNDRVMNSCLYWNDNKGMGITREKVGMKQYNMITGKKITTILMILFIFLSVFLMPNLGKWLVAEDELQESDMIVVLTGSVPDRIMQAVDIYNEKYSDKIVLVNCHRVGHAIFVERGLEIPPGDAQLSKMIAIDLGVPEENILILEGNAQSTQDEALIIREYIRNNRAIKSIILVTSKYHSGRSKKIFRKAFSGLDREINIYSSPSKYDPFNVNQWWKDREDIKRVVLEYLKLANFYFREQFLLD
ncbi:hypothetical protein ES705_33566 [subsurface metagenome]